MHYLIHLLHQDKIGDLPLILTQLNSAIRKHVFLTAFLALQYILHQQHLMG